MKQLLLACLMMCTTTTIAQDIRIIRINIWENHQPAHTTTLKEPQGTNDHGHITNCQTASIELYLPEGEAKKCIVICPGGGYGILAYKHEGAQFAEYLSKHGYAAVVLAYRMPNGTHQIPMEDVAQTFETLRQRSSELGIDPAQIGIMGFSAGGHLAATASVRLNPKPSFSILFYPVISFTDELTHAGSRKNLTNDDSSLYSYYSNELQVNEETPPALIFVSMDDSSVKPANSQAYRDALAKNQVDVTLIKYNNGGHGWGFNETFAGHDHMKKELINWLNKR